jgi:hypothetical protein
MAFIFAPRDFVLVAEAELIDGGDTVSVTASGVEGTRFAVPEHKGFVRGAVTFATNYTRSRLEPKVRTLCEGLAIVDTGLRAPMWLLKLVLGQKTLESRKGFIKMVQNVVT